MKCHINDCKKKISILGECKYCNNHYCIKHYMIESHLCKNIKEYKKKKFTEYEKKILGEKCISSKILWLN